MHLLIVFLFLAWDWLAKPKGHSSHTKITTPSKSFTENKRVKVRSTACHYGTQKRPVKITMYLTLGVIIKLKVTTIVIAVRYFNVPNCLTENLEPYELTHNIKLVR